ncbi:MAG: hypothetical protein V4713_15325 [Pseudomonadota bacterium]
MKNRFSPVVISIACLVLGSSGCSTASWYEGMKRSAENECEKQAPGAREDCLSRLNKKTYDSYEKERAARP